MKKAIKYIAVLAGALSLVSCGGDQNSKANAAPAKQAMPYPVTEVPTKTLTGYTTYPVSIEGMVNSEVRAKVSGYITDVLVDEGEKVNKGQVLFRLETQSLNQDAEAAKANVNAAQVEVDKLKPLVEKDIISEVQLETAKAKLQQAKSNYNSITANIGYANIKSPVDGYVGAIRLREGALVSPTSQAPLTTVSDISKVYAYFSLSEVDYLNFLQNNEGETVEDKIENMPKVELELANGNIYKEEGTIETINSQVNANTGSISFRAVFDNPSRLLTNGNSGKIRIPKIYENAVVVPQEATYEKQGKILVYKLGENNKVNTSVIEVLASIDNLYVVKSGVKKGDSIVAKGLAKLRPDTEIKPQPVAFDSIAKPIEQVFR
ncbi:membrane fusion protein (multidrug efflux system) [Christiangramia gaetbulicola]|uniref:Membrane fusion protein (Multidrug efflux system) n=1 Tax=Christiangramia gaetbulicola TaxID=703340 RepID=A0A2T6AME3_9FLAO|nr:efflux RND transporter periplasmic adaptor subunit [Christiangramia gaetbulicola]PTX44936.1 membrane fusion protein (multidrug efflux system) [Christiangramia gaetbulicola]